MIVDWISERARLSGEEIALVDAKRELTITYNQLNQRAENLAQYLTDKGVVYGDRIALISPNNSAYFELLFACSKIGAIFIPVNFHLKKDELEEIFNDCQPAAVFYYEECATRLPEGIKKISINGEGYDKAVNSESSPAFEAMEFSNEHPAVIMYTSGSTGNPKGVIISHRMLQANAMYTIPSWHLSDRDTTIATTPMYHTGGMFSLPIPLLLAGGKVVIQERFNCGEFFELNRTFQPTFLFMVPTMYQSLAKQKDFSGETFASMKAFISGGATLPEEMYDVFHKEGLPLINSYGLTEVGPNNFYLDPEISFDKINSVGKPNLFSHMIIVDENNDEVGQGEVGELLITGENQFSGYLNNSEATDEVMEGNYVRTGDLARQDTEGYYYIVGRKKDIIISGGENVAPVEVERTLNQHPAVADSIVVGVSHPKWGEAVVAGVVTEDSQSIEMKELKNFCKKTLTNYKVPKHFLTYDEFPENSVGKIDRKKIKEDIESQKLFN